MTARSNAIFNTKKVILSRNLYEILGVPSNATPEEIKQAYRKKAKECHPDTNPDDPNAEHRFKELSEAYAVLSDANKRRQYDMFGTVGRGANGFGGFETFDLSDALEMFMQAVGGMDPFGSFFGGMRNSENTRRSRSRKGEDLRITLELTLEELFTGITKKTKVIRKIPCPECKGSGIPPDAKEAVCPSCQGRGQKRVIRTTLLGTISTISTCSNCGGTGRKTTARCAKCSGEGRISSTETVEIEIPPGAFEGNYLVIENKGNAGIAGGPPGNLIAIVKELPHDTFQRRGRDLYYRLPLSFSQAALGDTAEIKTIDGKTKKLKIPEGTQFGQTFSLKNCGMPQVGGGSPGDLIVTAFVRTPKNISREEKRLFQQLSKFDESHSKEHEEENILERLKDLFT